MSVTAFYWGVNIGQGVALAIGGVLGTIGALLTGIFTGWGYTVYNEGLASEAITGTKHNPEILSVDDIDRSNYRLIIGVRDYRIDPQSGFVTFKDIGADEIFEKWLKKHDLDLQANSASMTKSRLTELTTHLYLSKRLKGSPEEASEFQHLMNDAQSSEKARKKVGEIFS